MEGSASPRAPPRRASDETHPSPLSSNLSRSRSKPTMFSKKPGITTILAGDVVAPPRRSLSSKENSTSTVLRAAVSQGLSFSEFGAAERRSPPPPAADAAWRRRVALTTEPTRRGGAGGLAGGGGVLGMFTRRRKEAPEAEAAAYQLRALTARLLQWRFANARTEKAMAGAKCAAENKLFYTWLRVAELRNMVAAKLIMAQRRKQKLKLARVLRPQVQLLVMWEQAAKQHADAVAVSGRALSAACTPLPLADGAQANLMQLHNSMFTLTDTVNEIEANAEMFYSEAKMMSSTLGELVETIRLEMEGLEEVMRLSRDVTRLQMQEVSLRTSLIQARQRLDPAIGSEPAILGYSF